MEPTLSKHLIERNFRISRYNGCTVTDVDMTVLLWNLSGQLVGYQVYNPSLPKKAKEPRDMKYFTNITKGQDGVFGLETVKWTFPYLFVCEGIFDAARLHAYGLPAIAVLGHHPTHLTSWLKALPHTTVAAVQGDKAGLMLALVTDLAIYLPEGEDVGSLSEQQFNDFFKPFFDPDPIL